MNVTKTFSRASTVNLKMVQLAQTQKKSLSADLFLFKFQSFRISFYLLLCKVWKHKVHFYQTYLVNVLYGQAYRFEMIVYKWTNKIDPSPITLPYDMNSSSAFMRSLGEAPIIVIRSKNSKLHIITFILFKITPNNLDKQLIFGDN